MAAYNRGIIYLSHLKHGNTFATERPLSAMRKTTTNPNKPVVRPFSFMRRLKEIDLFFAKRSPQHRTMRRLIARMKKAGISYAIVGGMAVNAHRAERTTKDVDVLVTQQGLARFRQEFVGSAYEPVEGRPRRFEERQSGIKIDFLITGRYPGLGKPGPIAFPDPDEASEEIGKARVLTLAQLIQLKLAARRHGDFYDVELLIAAHDLNESFLEQLHPSVHRDFIECLEETRRQDEYEARE